MAIFKLSSPECPGMDLIINTNLAYATLLFLRERTNAQDAGETMIHLVLGLVLLGEANGKSQDESLSDIGTIYRLIDDMLRASEVPAGASN